MMILSRSAELAGNAFTNHPVCAGPFKFFERVPQDRIVLDHFTDYWDKERIFIDRVIYRPIFDSTVRFANLRSEDLNLTFLAATDYADIRNYPNLKGASVPGYGWSYYIAFNLDNGARAHGPLGHDPRVREAFELALDRAAINEVVFVGQHIPSNQWVTPDDPYYIQALPIPARDVSKARKLLSAAGFPRLSMELMTLTSAELKQVAEVIQAMTQEAGFEVRIRPTETATAYRMSRKGDFEAFLTGTNPYGDPDVFIQPLVACDGTFNEGHYCNHEVDDAIANARSHLASEDRTRFYADVASRVLRDQPVIFLTSPRIFFGHTTRLTGFQPSPDGFIHLQGVKLNPN
jgi:peptide/nickel transport system substrate-binding protein